jgi:membrane-bound inhibitor of C-type lysozyme
MRTSLLLAISCSALLGACEQSMEPRTAPRTRADTTTSPADAPVSDKREYQCGEIVVSADFHGHGPVKLRYDGNELTLPQVASASGARYADERGNEFWSKGDHAMFTIAGQSMRNCAPKTAPRS